MDYFSAPYNHTEALERKLTQAEREIESLKAEIKLLISQLGDPVHETETWTEQRLLNLVDVVSCYVAERDNFLDTDTRVRLIERALNMPSKPTK